MNLDAFSQGHVMMAVNWVESTRSVGINGAVPFASSMWW